MKFHRGNGIELPRGGAEGRRALGVTGGRGEEIGWRLGWTPIKCETNVDNG